MFSKRTEGGLRFCAKKIKDFSRSFKDFFKTQGHEKYFGKSASRKHWIAIELNQVNIFLLLSAD